MNDDKENPAIELRLAIGLGNQSTETRSDKKLGAGANAGSKEEMNFARVTPVSELVWSPKKGVSLKCADSSLPNKSLSLLCGVGSSDLVRPLSQKITAGETKDNVHVNEEKVGSPTDLHLACKVSEEVRLVGSSTPRDTARISPPCRVTSHGNNLDSDNGRSANSSSIKTDKPKFDFTRGKQEPRNFDVGTSSSPLELEEDNKEKPNEPLWKQESTAENDLQTITRDLACAEASFVKAKPPDEGKSCDHHHEGILLLTEVPTVEARRSSSEGRLCQRNDKGKALWDEEDNERISKDEDGSQESVESCNSTRLQSTRKRKWNSDQQLAVESKKMKQNDYKSCELKSLYKQDSSFMNWISNMVKGVSNSVPNDTPSVALTMRTNHGNRSKETNTGFQTIFKQLYCRSSVGKENKMLTLEDYRQVSNEHELANKVNENDGYRSSNDDKGKQVVSLVHGEGLSALPNIRLGNCDDGAKSSRSPSNMSSNPKKAGNLSPDSSSGKDPDSPSEGKEASKGSSIDPNKTSRSDSHKNLWIARFSPKVTGLVQSSNNRHENVTSFQVPKDRTKILSHAHDFIISQKDKNVLEDPISDESKNNMNSVSNSGGSFGFKRRALIHEKKHKFNSNVIRHSQRLKNSVALASVFARRLDALRHIIPSEVDGSHSNITCFFCGIKGHKLQDCSEITEAEIDNLLQKINQYEGKEETSCLCIRCFQLSHWAISCPYSSTRKEGHLDGNASIPSFCTKNPRVDTEIEVGKSSGMRMTKMDFGLKPTETGFFDETSGRNTSKGFILNGKQTASSSTDNVSIENQTTAFCNFIHWQIPVVPRETLEAIKRLRLSRTDILKWTKSSTSFYCLNGFFVRLRLRKWEVGGTGYFVACINEDKTFGNHKLSLSVNIAGFKCLVDSRFVSNHDYTEDELMAWWCAILKSGGQMPSEEDLRTKFELKKKLGL